MPSFLAGVRQLCLLAKLWPDLCKVFGHVGESDADLTIRILLLGPAVMRRPEPVEPAVQFVVEAAFTAGDLLQCLVDVVRQPLQLTASVLHARLDGVRVLMHLVDVITPVLLLDDNNQQLQVRLGR